MCSSMAKAQYLYISLTRVIAMRLLLPGQKKVYDKNSLYDAHYIILCVLQALNAKDNLK